MKKISILILISLLISSFVNASSGSNNKIEIDKKMTKYLKMLQRRPAPGYLFDRFYSTWLEKYSFEDLEKHLSQLSSKDASYQVIIGLLYEKESRYSEAQTAYQTALLQSSDKGLIYFYLGKLEANLLDLENATTHLEAAIKSQLKERDLDQAKLLLGQVYMRNSQKDKALKTWKELFEKSADKNDVRQDIIDTLLEEGLEDEALTTLSKAIDQSSDAYNRVLLMLKSGRLQWHNGEQQKALETFENALAKVGKNSWLEKDILFQIENIYRQADDLIGLHDFYENALKKDPAHLSIIEALVNYYSNEEDYKNALKTCLQLTKIAPNKSTFLEKYISLLLISGDTKQALLQQKMLIKNNPNNAELELKLANICHKLKDKKSTTSAIMRFIEKSSGADYEYMRAARMLSAFDCPQEALLIYKKLTNMHPENLQIFEAYAEELYKNDEHQKALSTFKAIVAKASLEQFIRICDKLLLLENQQISKKIFFSRQDDFKNEIAYLRKKSAFLTKPNQEKELTELLINWFKITNKNSDFDEISSHLKEHLKKHKKLEAFIEEIRNNNKASINEKLLLVDHIEKENPNEAEEVLQLLEKQNPNSGLVRHCYLKFAKNVHNSQKVKAILERFIRLDKNRNYYQIIVNNCLEENDNEEVRHWLRQWKKFFPNDNQPWTFECNLLENEGNYEELTQTLRRAAAKFKDEDIFKDRLIEHYRSNHQYEKAIHVLNRMLDEESDLTKRLTIIQKLYVIHNYNGSLESFIINFKTRAEGNKKSALPHLGLAFIYGEMDNFEKQNRHLRHALNLDPQNTKLLITLSELETQNGNSEKALSYLRQAAKIDPTSQARQKLLIHTFIEQEQIDKSFLNSLSAKEISEKEAENYLVRLINSREYEKSLALVERFSSLYPQNYRLLLFEALLLEYNGKKDDALQKQLAIIRTNFPIISWIKKNLPPEYVDANFKDSLEYCFYTMRTGSHDIKKQLRTQQYSNGHYNHSYRYSGHSRNRASLSNMILSGPQFPSQLKYQCLTHIRRLIEEDTQEQKDKITAMLQKNGFSYAWIHINITKENFKNESFSEKVRQHFGSDLADEYNIATLINDRQYQKTDGDIKRIMAYYTKNNLHSSAISLLINELESKEKVSAKKIIEVYEYYQQNNTNNAVHNFINILLKCDDLNPDKETEIVNFIRKNNSSNSYFSRQLIDYHLKKKNYPAFFKTFQKLLEADKANGISSYYSNNSFRSIQNVPVLLKGYNSYNQSAHIHKSIEASDLQAFQKALDELEDGNIKLFFTIALHSGNTNEGNPIATILKKLDIDNTVDTQVLIMAASWHYQNERIENCLELLNRLNNLTKGTEQQQIHSYAINCLIKSVSPRKYRNLIATYLKKPMKKTTSTYELKNFQKLLMTCGFKNEAAKINISTSRSSSNNRNAYGAYSQLRKGEEKTHKFAADFIARQSVIDSASFRSNRLNGLHNEGRLYKKIEEYNLSTEIEKYLIPDKSTKSAPILYRAAYFYRKMARYNLDSSYSVKAVEKFQKIQLLYPNNRMAALYIALSTGGENGSFEAIEKFLTKSQADRFMTILTDRIDASLRKDKMIASELLIKIFPALKSRKINFLWFKKLMKIYENSPLLDLIITQNQTNNTYRHHYNSNTAPKISLPQEAENIYNAALSTPGLARSAFSLLYLTKSEKSEKLFKHSLRIMRQSADKDSLTTSGFLEEFSPEKFAFNYAYRNGAVQELEEAIAEIPNPRLRKDLIRYKEFHDMTDSQFLQKFEEQVNKKDTSTNSCAEMLSSAVNTERKVDLYSQVRKIVEIYNKKNSVPPYSSILNWIETFQRDQIENRIADIKNLTITKEDLKKADKDYTLRNRIKEFSSSIINRMAMPNGDQIYLKILLKVFPGKVLKWHASELNNQLNIIASNKNKFLNSFLVNDKKFQLIEVSSGHNGRTSVFEIAIKAFSLPENNDYINEIYKEVEKRNEFSAAITKVAIKTILDEEDSYQLPRKIGAAVIEYCLENQDKFKALPKNGRDQLGNYLVSLSSSLQNNSKFNSEQKDFLAELHKNYSNVYFEKILNDEIDLSNYNTRRDISSMLIVVAASNPEKTEKVFDLMIENARNNQSSHYSSATRSVFSHIRTYQIRDNQENYKIAPLFIKKAIEVNSEEFLRDCSEYFFRKIYKNAYDNFSENSTNKIKALAKTLEFFAINYSSIMKTLPLNSDMKSHLSSISKEKKKELLELMPKSRELMPILYYTIALDHKDNKANRDALRQALFTAQESLNGNDTFNSSIMLESIASTPTSLLSNDLVQVFLPNLIQAKYSRNHYRFIENMLQSSSSEQVVKLLMPYLNSEFYDNSMTYLFNAMMNLPNDKRLEHLPTVIKALEIKPYIKSNYCWAKLLFYIYENDKSVVSDLELTQRISLPYSLNSNDNPKKKEAAIKVLTKAIDLPSLSNVAFGLLAEKDSLSGKELEELAYKAFKTDNGDSVFRENSILKINRPVTFIVSEAYKNGQFTKLDQLHKEMVQSKSYKLELLKEVRHLYSLDDKDFLEFFNEKAQIYPASDVELRQMIKIAIATNKKIDLSLPIYKICRILQKDDSRSANYPYDVFFKWAAHQKIDNFSLETFLDQILTNSFDKSFIKNINQSMSSSRGNRYRREAIIDELKDLPYSFPDKIFFDEFFTKIATERELRDSSTKRLKTIISFMDDIDYVKQSKIAAPSKTFSPLSIVDRYGESTIMETVLNHYCLPSKTEQRKKLIKSLNQNHFGAQLLSRLLKVRYSQHGYEALKFSIENPQKVEVLKPESRRLLDNFIFKKISLYSDFNKAPLNAKENALFKSLLYKNKTNILNAILDKTDTGTKTRTEFITDLPLFHSVDPQKTQKAFTLYCDDIFAKNKRDRVARLIFIENIKASQLTSLANSWMPNYGDPIAFLAMIYQKALQYKSEKHFYQANEIFAAFFDEAYQLRIQAGKSPLQAYSQTIISFDKHFNNFMPLLPICNALHTKTLEVNLHNLKAELPKLRSQLNNSNNYKLVIQSLNYAEELKTEKSFTKALLKFVRDKSIFLPLRTSLVIDASEAAHMRSAKSKKLAFPGELAQCLLPELPDYDKLSHSNRTLIVNSFVQLLMDDRLGKANKYEEKLARFILNDKYHKSVYSSYPSIYFTCRQKNYDLAMKIFARFMEKRRHNSLYIFSCIAASGDSEMAARFFKEFSHKIDPFESVKWYRTQTSKDFKFFSSEQFNNLSPDIQVLSRFFFGLADINHRFRFLWSAELTRMRQAISQVEAHKFNDKKLGDKFKSWMTRLHQNDRASEIFVNQHLKTDPMKALDGKKFNTSYANFLKTRFQDDPQSILTIAEKPELTHALHNLIEKIPVQNFFYARRPNSLNSKVYKALLKQALIIDKNTPKLNEKQWRDQLTKSLFPKSSDNWFIPEGQIPKSWKTQAINKSWENGASHFNGSVFLRRDFELTDEASKIDKTINLAAIDDADFTFINGQLIGHTNHWSTKRHYKIPASYLRQGRNTIVVIMINPAGPGGPQGADKDYLIKDKNQQFNICKDWRSLSTKNYPDYIKGFNSDTSLQVLFKTAFMIALFENKLDDFKNFLEQEAPALTKLHRGKLRISDMQNAHKTIHINDSSSDRVADFANAFIRLKSHPYFSELCQENPVFFFKTSRSLQCDNKEKILRKVAADLRKIGLKEQANGFIELFSYSENTSKITTVTEKK